MKERIAAIFTNLDRWRHLPNYQLERRTDIFFSIYLKSLAEEFSGVELLDIIIPELPIKVDGSSRSFKVDYVLFSKDRKTAFFIELKTDSASRRDEQDEYLRTAVAGGLEKVLLDLKEIAGKTVSYRKYGHLFRMLAAAEVIRVPKVLNDFLYPKIKPGLRACIEKIEVLPNNTAIRVIYVQPATSCYEKSRKPDGAIEDCIDFDFIIKHLKRCDDGFSSAFAAHLERWKQAAGDDAPESYASI